MDEQYINLPVYLGLRVIEILSKEYNIEPRKNKMGMMSFEFLKKELDLIKELKITNPIPGELEGLEQLTNLTSLDIKTKGITAHVQDKNIRSINDKDSEAISKCTSLKNLSIVNQARIGCLDLTKLSNLQYLNITHNEHLNDIYGLDQLEDLWELNCFGNNRLFNIENLPQAIQNNKNLSELNLDVLLFPNAIDFNTSTGSYNQSVVSQIKEISEVGKVSWKESLNGNRAISINNYQMLQLHNKACEILANNVTQALGKRDVIIGIENYMAQNIKYDHEGIKTGHTRTVETFQGGPKMIIGPKNGTNSAYNALVKNTSVCEGYTRGMQYLLKLKGINSHNVDCFAGKDTTHMADGKQDRYTIYELPTSGYHSIICIDDYNSLYDDPCWNASRYQKGDKSMPWVLKTKKEISEDHTLSFDERNVDNNNLVEPRNIIQASIQRNELFRQTRLSSINSTRGSIKEKIKGQVFQKGDHEI